MNNLHPGLRAENDRRLREPPVSLWGILNCRKKRGIEAAQSERTGGAWGQGRYLGVGEVDPMVPGIGWAPRKGDHTGSLEAIPANACESTVRAFLGYCQLLGGFPGANPG